MTSCLHWAAHSLGVREACPTTSTHGKLTDDFVSAVWAFLPLNEFDGVTMTHRMRSQNSYVVNFSTTRWYLREVMVLQHSTQNSHKFKWLMVSSHLTAGHTKTKVRKHDAVIAREQG